MEIQLLLIRTSVSVPFVGGFSVAKESDEEEHATNDDDTNRGTDSSEQHRPEITVCIVVVRVVAAVGRIVASVVG